MIMTCPKCGSMKNKKNGKKKDTQRYKCKDCNREYLEGYDNIPTSNTNTSSAVEELNYTYLTDNIATGETPTLESLLSKFKVSEEIWKVTNFKINQWDVSAKEEVDGKIVWNTHTNYQARASLVRKIPIVCDFPTIQGAKVSPLKFNVKTPKRKLKVDVILPDSQCGFKRNCYCY
jgi:hypothetical protein